MKFNQKKFIKRFIIYNKNSDNSPENSTDEFNFYPAVVALGDNSFSSFFWANAARNDEIENSRPEANASDNAETAKPFKKIKKPDKEIEDSDGNEVWSFGAGRGRRSTGVIGFEDAGKPDGTGNEKTFWKLSKMSLPGALAGKSSRFALDKAGMLWRSVENIQHLYEDGYVQQVSEVIDVRFENDFSATPPQTRGTMKKARLSRWNFLKYEGKNDDDVGVAMTRPQEREKQTSSALAKSRSYAKYFFIRRKTHSKSKSEEVDDAEVLADGSEDTSTNLEDDPCDCSCCSCDTCTNTSSETSRNSVSSKENMAPNSEEDFQNKRSWGTELTEKEPLRPPLYNPEDYATSLKKWGRKGNSGMQISLYLSQSTGSIEKLSGDFGLRESSCGPSSMSAKSSSSIKSTGCGDDKHSKKDFTLKMEKKDLKNKENVHRGIKSDVNVDLRNPILPLASQEGEMSLRQFSSVTELLGKLKVDLKLSFPSFVQEFVGDPVDGVTLLLELLRSVQLFQASQQQRRPPQIFRRALLDEHSCLICLKHCLRCSDATRRLVSSMAGLFTLAVCVMSNVTQSRIIALELLTKACEIPVSGHKAVSEALSTLRLRFGEPVRFRFLVGMLNSAGTVELLATAMKFINKFVETAPSIQHKVYIQAELEQAGFDSKTLRNTLPSNSETVKMELNKWEKYYLNVENLQSQADEVHSLHEKIQILEKRIEILQEEKGILQSLEQCLKERCSELEEEISIKTNATAQTPSTKTYHHYNFQECNKRNAEKGESTPAEDEGISSSEQELSQDEDYIKTRVHYANGKGLTQQKNNGNETSRDKLNVVKEIKGLSNKTHENPVSASCSAKNYKNSRNKMKETNVDDGSEIIRPEGYCNEEEEETTIDEVIEELENIVNDAETEVYGGEEIKKSRERAKFSIPVRGMQENNVSDVNRTSSRPIDEDVFEETEIIPSQLHPQPPRKTKSLVHIYLPRRDFDDHDHHGKSEFFDEDTDTESSDSLLTATREKRSNNKSCHRSLDVTDSFGTFSSTNTRMLFIKQEDDYEESEVNVKKSFEEKDIDLEKVNWRNSGLVNGHFAPNKVHTEDFSSPIFFKDNKFGADTKKPVFQKDFIAERMAREFYQVKGKIYGNNVYEKTTSFQESSEGDQSVQREPRKSQNCAPTPVKRSQSFHITTSDRDVLPYKRADIKPKPKMGVSGLDFQRNTEQKIKTDQGEHQSFEYKKNVERRLDSNERYTKKATRDHQKSSSNGDANKVSGGSHLHRRGSFDGVVSVVETGGIMKARNEKSEGSTSQHCDPESSTSGGERPCAKIRSKSLEKIEEGLNAFVDIVISTGETKKHKPKNESNGEPTKNIGPRTRKSLAESSLFIPPRERMSTTKVEETAVPPKPAQRTSLARHNSSSTPLHIPKEIKLAPVQPNPRQQMVYNFGVKSSKSEGSLFSASKRCPPDGSSSPTHYKNKENQMSSNDQTPIYSIPVKPSKSQNSLGDSSRTTYFNNTDKSDQTVSPMPRNLQNASSNHEKFKASSPPHAVAKTSASKPNFLLGTYQSQVTKNIPKPSSSVMNSINNFNNTFLGKKSSGNGKSYSPGYRTDNVKDKLNEGEPPSQILNKLTDSPSGLY